MIYYAHINSKDILTGIDMSRLSADEYGSEDVKNIEVDKTLYDTAQEYGIEYYIYQDGGIIENPNYSDEFEQKERERLDNLSMTRGDVFEAFILAKGIGKTQIRAMIESLDLDDITKALYLNRFDEALNFYRGYPIFNILGEILDITPQMLDKFFETKDYHELLPAEEKTINTTDR